MTDRGVVPSAEPYAPLRRTALVLTGTGTAGAYHAGALRALDEAGVKIDVVAARGVGVVGALFAAVDGAARLWDERGFWRSPGVHGLYPWRPWVRAIVWALALCVAIVAVPIATMAVGLVVFPVDFVLKMVGGTGGGLTGAYVRLVERAFAPEALPTWLPRLVLLTLGTTALAALGLTYRPASARRLRGPVWWRMVPAPLSSAGAIDRLWTSLWELVRGATQLKEPPRLDLARRYLELLAENLGQPGFRELLVVVHDVDAGRDLVCALVHESRRRDLTGRALNSAAEARRAEVVDLAGASRDHLADVVAAALTLPLATEFHDLQYSPESYWRGERHRVSDRLSALDRIVDELVALGVEQIVLVSAAPEPRGPHELGRPRIDGRGRVGEVLQSSEAAVVRDVLARSGADGPRIYPIYPSHNPVGPLDFSGAIDERSARKQGLSELMNRGYEDAYRQFVEPVVGASGDRVGQAR
jgi:hypothetical protein